MIDSKQIVHEDARSLVFNYLQLLWFRRRLIIIITIFVGVLGLAWFTQQAPVYRSTSGLMIMVPETQAMDIESEHSADSTNDISDGIEVLRSRDLVTKVLTQLQALIYAEFNPSQIVESKGLRGIFESLKSKGQDWSDFARKNIGMETMSAEELSGEAQLNRSLTVATNIFLSKLSVEQAGRSNVINISFESLDPEFAARAANTLAEVYIATQLQHKIDNSESVSAWLSQQFSELKEQAAASDGAVAFYRNTFALTEAANTELLDQQLSDIKSRIIIARVEKAEAIARLGRVASAPDYSVFEEDTEALASPEIRQLLGQRAALAKRAEELALEYGSDHPKMVELSAETSVINDALRSEVNKITIDLQNEVDAVSDRASALEASLTEAVQKSGTQHRRLLQLRELEKEAIVNRVKFESFLERFKESSFTSDLITPDSQIISRADVSLLPLYPDRNRKLMNTVIAGLLIAVIVVFLLQLRNPGMLSPEHVEHELKTSTIGVIPKVPGKQASHDYLLENPESDFAEAVNALKATLDLSDLDKQVKVIQLVSSVHGEGKTSLAISLARVVAKSAQKVLLVNADLRSTSTEEKLGLPLKAKGLTDLMLSNENELTDYVMTDVKGGIHFLSAGTAEYANADVVFSSQRMKSVVELMKSQYDFIVFDAPPVRSAADAIVISKLVDKTLFIIRWNQTEKRVAKTSLQQLYANGVDLAGVVLQQVSLQRYGKISYSDLGYLYHQRY